jgi:hypothetical protein
MKTKEEINKKIGELSHTEISKLEYIIKVCERLMERKLIDEDTLKDLSNMYTEIHIIKESFTLRLIRILKQNHMLD